MSKIRTAVQNPSFWLGILILAGFILGLNIFQDYGVSFDEPGIHNFAPVVIDMYSTAFDPPEKPVFQRESFLHRSRIPTDLFNYGPFYFVATELFVRGLQTLGVQAPYWELWHLAYFITFEIGLVIFYLLCRRWLSGWASLGATALFATQPLILGHVFMNPKDPPFMLFFMAAVWSGLLMADKLRFQPSDQHGDSKESLPSSIKTEWREISQNSKVKARRNILVLGGMLLLLILAQPFLDGLVQKSITAIYSAPATSIPGSILRTLSSSPENIPMENFITKGQVWLLRLVLLVALFIIGRALWVVYSLLPKSGQRVGQSISSPFRLFFRYIFNPFVLLAGILFGLTLSIRMFAPLAGGLVIVNLFWKARRQAILPALAYGLIALTTSYITWPYLWGEPIKRIIKSWQVMNAFSIPGSWSSLPSLLAIQYTEPAVLLALAGTIIAIVEFIRGKRSGLLFLFLGWGLLPMSVLMLKEANLYNNFRQVLFIIPPFFMIAGLAMEKIIQSIHRPILAGSVMLLLLLPGILACLRLHPYEYVYYNQFIGGVSNASRQFDTDYWAVSAKETAQYLNEAAPENATILACGPVYTLELYLRDDLHVTACEDKTVAAVEHDYLIVSGRGYIDKNFFPQAKVVYTVNRENTVLAYVKSLREMAK